MLYFIFYILKSYTLKNIRIVNPHKLILWNLQLKLTLFLKNHQKSIPSFTKLKLCFQAINYLCFDAFNITNGIVHQYFTIFSLSL